MNTLKMSILIFSFSLNLTAQWDKTSPSNPVSCIKNNGSTIYIGTDDSHISSSYADGVLKSEDNGQTWQILNNGLTDKTIHAMEIVGTNLFVGTFDGVFKSTNQVESWTPKNTGIPFLNITALAAFDNSTLFAAQDNNYSYGIYKSTNLGDNWTYVTNAGRNIHVIAINGMNIFLGTHNGIIRSTDGGINWTHLNGPASIVNSIAFSGSTIFAGEYFGIYRSTDNGNTWEFLSAGPNANIMALAAKEQTILAGTYSIGIFISTDLGNTWVSMNDGLIDKHILSLSVIDSIVYAGTNLGLFRLKLSQTNWTPCSYTPNDISFIKSISEYIYAGGAFGLCRSTDNGLNWMNYYSDEFNFDFEYSTTDLISLNNELFASFYNYGLVKSTDYGLTWFPLDNWPVAYSIHGFAVKGEKLFAIAHPNRIFMSTNGGINWQSISGDLGNFNFHKLISKGENLFITTQEGVFFSSNDGRTWLPRNNGLHGLNNSEIAVIDSIIFVPSTGGINYSTNEGLNWGFKEWPFSAYVSCLFPFENYLFMGTYGRGMYMSSDFGDSWILIDDSMPEGFTVSAIALHGTNLLAGTASAGIWQRPISQIITEIEEDVNNNQFLYSLSQNYPNPFNPRTKIKFTIPSSPLNPSPYQGEGNRERFVTLKVYDVLGNEIATLVNEEKPAGSYEVEFFATGGGSELSSGIYFYQLIVRASFGSARNYVETKKMVLLR